MTTTLPTGRSSFTGATAVRLDGVRKAFGPAGRAVVALDGVDLTVAPGEFVCLLGASGCGKSTLLNLVAGLDAPSAGEITLNTSRPAVMFQEAALMPWLTAARNVELPLRLAGFGRAERREKAAELLDLVRLNGAGGKRPHELSGGMRQRVALARALAATLRVGGDPEQALLLMDEPFAALDAITRDVLQGELLRVYRSTGTSVLFVTHDVREAVRLGQRVVLLSSRPGKVVREWTDVPLADAEELHRGDHRAPARGDQHPCRSLTRLPKTNLDAVGAGLDSLDAPVGERRPSFWKRFAWGFLPPVLALVLLIVVWQILWAAAFWSEAQLPAPIAVWDEFWSRVVTGEVFGFVWTSVHRAALGFLAGVVIGTPLGLVVAKVRVVRAAIGPLLTGLQSLPSVAWVPAAILWFGINDGAIYFVVLLGSVPSIANGLVSGIDQIPPILPRVGQVMGAGPAVVGPAHPAAGRAARVTWPG